MAPSSSSQPIGVFRRKNRFMSYLTLRLIPVKGMVQVEMPGIYDESRTDHLLRSATGSNVRELIKGHTPQIVVIECWNVDTRRI